jgi:glutathione S-transferase
LRAIALSLLYRRQIDLSTQSASFNNNYLASELYASKMSCHIGSATTAPEARRKTMLKLYGRSLSPFVRRVQIALNLAGIPYELVGLSTVTDRAEIAALNPVGRVPIVELDSGERIIDSAAIVTRIAEMGRERGIDLRPDSGDVARLVKVEAVAMGVAEKSVASLYESTRRPADKIYAEWVAACDTQCRSGLVWLNGELKGHDRFAQHFQHTADIACYVAYQNVRAANPAALNAIDLADLDRFMARCEADAAFASVRAE